MPAARSSSNPGPPSQRGSGGGTASVPTPGEAPATARETGGAQTLARGLAVLEALAAEPSSVADLSARLGLHRSIVTRLVRTLSERAYVVRGDDHRYRLSTKLLDLARSVEDPVRTALRPLLAELAERVGATAVLTVVDAGDGLCIEAVEPRDSHVHVAYRPGRRHPLDRSASGLAILAALPPRPGERPEVARARERGYAVTAGELEPGTVGVAVPVRLPARDDPGSVAVVGLAGSLEVDRVAPVLLGAARAFLPPGWPAPDRLGRRPR